MADTQSQLEIVIAAQDQASQQLAQISEALNRLNSQAEATQETTGRANASFGLLTGAFAAGQLAADAITGGVERLHGVLNDSIDTARRYQASLEGVRLVGAEMGQSTDQITAAI